MTVFEELNAINVNGHTEQKSGLTYLSWCWAWGELIKRYPQAKYEIVKFEDKPYLYDSKLGYMVFTKVTIDEDTKEMWLPVMDGNNKAMKDVPYKYMTKNGERVCQAATMFDINKTIMRCLVKNIAMFGLGLYIFAGEDLPEGYEEPINEKQKAYLLKVYGERINELLEKNEINSLEEMSFDKASQIIEEIARRKHETNKQTQSS